MKTIHVVMILNAVVLLAWAAVVINMQDGCTTDTECACVEDCLE